MRRCSRPRKGPTRHRRFMCSRTCLMIWRVRDLRMLSAEHDLDREAYKQEDCQHSPGDAKPYGRRITWSIFTRSPATHVQAKINSRVFEIHLTSAQSNMYPGCSQGIYAALPAIASTIVAANGESSLSEIYPTSSRTLRIAGRLTDATTNADLLHQSAKEGAPKSKNLRSSPCTSYHS